MLSESPDHRGGFRISEREESTKTTKMWRIYMCTHRRFFPSLSSLGVPPPPPTKRGGGGSDQQNPSNPSQKVQSVKGFSICCRFFIMVYRYFLLSTVATKYNFLSERLIGRVELYIWATVLRNGDQNSIFICAHVIREKRKTFDHNIFFL